MIETCKAFKVGESTYPTIEQAQTAELLTMGFEKSVADSIIKDAGKIVDILTTTPTSKLKARKINGGTKTRKAKTPAETPAANATT